MFTLKNRRAWPLTTFYHRPWPSSLAVASRLDPSQPIEEEKTPHYHPDRFYPARLGQVLNKRYQLATKLGYGSSSTVWLARDLYRFILNAPRKIFDSCLILGSWRWSKERYVAIKINASSRLYRENAAETELSILEKISRANSQHKGWLFVRKVLDFFTIDGVSKKHVCLVLEPLREPLWIYRRRYVGGVIPSDILKLILQMILHGLDYLHSECQVIHTGMISGSPDGHASLLEWCANEQSRFKARQFYGKNRGSIGFRRRSTRRV